MKKYFLILSALLLLAQHSWATQARHVVFLVHGIGSSAKHFATTEEVLKTTMPRLDPEFGYEFVRFQYETGDDQRTTFDFAKDLGVAISKHFEKSAPIKQGDKLSFVMHSQGGLVGLIWLWHVFLPNAEYHAEYAPYVDAFITLGTPFWGAKMATFSHTLKDWTERLHLPFPFPMGAIELREMSFGSETIFAIRRAATRPDFQELLARIRAQVRPLSLGGIVGKLRPLAPIALGLNEYEDDTAVPLPSSRFDFIYALADRPHESGDVIRYDEFQETGLANLQVVNAIHASPVPEWRELPGIAQLPERCASEEPCDHPSFSHLVSHLAQDLPPPDEGLLKRLTGFMLDLSIRIPEGSKLRTKDVKIRFAREHYGWIPWNRDVTVGHPLEFYSRGKSNAENNPEYLRFYYTGSIRNSYVPAEGMKAFAPFSDRKLTFEVSAPGYKWRKVEAKVRATFTTFLELNLEPKQ